ncbi:DUF3137 domain-containing protein [uncultured Erythrobacter sp.]|uniref:DUF3137 domain-containing protein n=1 Tax=uncultured Erythrobacter sp. TaxID=263913 RepID=UPI00260352AF|nr:DUF3137 domain-containing protein [uncultured Erythrobacter sp.]
MRDAATKKARNRWFYAGIAALPVIAFILFMPFELGMFRLFLSGFIGFGVFAWGYAPINEAKKTIKVGINSAIARSLGISYEHDLVPGEEYEAARRYGLLPSYQRDSQEDRWFGELEGHPFNLYEAHLEQRRGSGKNRRWVTVFRGAIISMGFGRNFHSTTLLQRKGKHKKWFGFGGRADHAEFGDHRLDYVDQVHPDFEGVFEVWSDDQVEARVLIHPSYVEHLLSLERVFNGDAVRALFRKGEVIIAIESGNMFESGSMKAEKDAEHAAETAEQFAAMARLATAINQNERGRVLSKESRGRP